MELIYLIYGVAVLFVATETVKEFAVPPEFDARMVQIQKHGFSQKLLLEEESFDLEGGRAAFLLDERGDKLQLILDFENQTFTEIRNNYACNVDQIGDLEHLLFRETGMGISIGKILNIPRAYEGNSEVHGIVTDQWTGNITLLNTTFKVQADFAASNWSFPFVNSSWNRPVRLEISEYNHTENDDQEIKSSYLFMDFVDDINEKMFQIPSGFYCPAMKQNVKAIPILTTSFTVGIEAIEFYDDGTNVKLQMEISYDQRARVSRTNVREVLTKFDENQKDVLTIIEDRETQDIYFLDKTTGKCLKEMPTLAVNPTEIIKKILFGNDNMTNAHYIGKRPCRIDECDVYATMVGNTIFNIDMRHQDGREELYYPLSMRKWEKNEKKQQIELLSVEEFFNFEFTDPKWSNFDFFACFKNASDSIRLQVTFDGGIDKIAGKIDIFERSFVEAVHVLTGISHTRINRIKVDSMFTSSVIVTATLIKGPPIKDSSSRNSFKSNQEAYNDLASAIFNKKFTVTVDNFNFPGTDITDKGFSENEADHNIRALGKYEAKKDRDLVFFPGVHTVTGTTLEDCVTMCDNHAAVDCKTFSFCRSRGVCKMLNERLQFIPEQNLTENTDCILYSRTYESDFKLYDGVELKKENSDDSIDNVNSLEDCYAACEFRTGPGKGTCQSFDKCGSTCNYHAYHILEVSNDQIIKNPNCRHYSRNYIDLFILMPKTTFTSDDWIRIKREADVDTCALYCFTDPEGCTDFEMSTISSEDHVKTICTLMTVKAGVTNPSFSSNRSDLYDHYRLRDPKPAIPGDIPSTPFSNHCSDSYKEIGYSKGEMTALGICMAILGGLIGAFVVYVVARHQAMMGEEDHIVLQMIGRG